MGGRHSSVFSTTPVAHAGRRSGNSKQQSGQKTLERPHRLARIPRTHLFYGAAPTNERERSRPGKIQKLQQKLDEQAGSRQNDEVRGHRFERALLFEQMQ